jgi:hypothetical protein
MKLTLNQHEIPTEGDRPARRALQNDQPARNHIGFLSLILQTKTIFLTVLTTYISNLHKLNVIN